MLKDNSIFIVKKIFSLHNTLHIIGNQCTNTDPLFLRPCNSSNLQICIIDSKLEENITVPISEIKKKCLKLTYSGCKKPVIVPLIHHN